MRRSTAGVGLPNTLPFSLGVRENSFLRFLRFSRKHFPISVGHYAKKGMDKIRAIRQQRRQSAETANGQSRYSVRLVKISKASGFFLY